MLLGPMLSLNRQLDDISLWRTSELSRVECQSHIEKAVRAQAVQHIHGRVVGAAAQGIKREIERGGVVGAGNLESSGGNWRMNKWTASVESWKSTSARVALGRRGS